MKATVVFNRTAGNASDDVLQTIKRRLASSFDLHIDMAEDLRSSAQDAIRKGAQLIIAAGGDGTVSAVAGAVLGSDAALGILPLGTSNSIADALSIGGDIESACDNLIAGNVRVVDSACMNDGRTMVLMCSVGLHAETITETAQEKKSRWGVLAYVATALKKLKELEQFDVEMETEAHVIRCRAVAVTVANVAPSKTLVAQGPPTLVCDDGLLDVTVISAEGLTNAVATGIHLYRSAQKGEAATRDEVGYFSCTKVRILAEPRQSVLVDGESAGMTPVVINCRPSSLRVIAPACEQPPSPPDAKLAGLPDVEVEKK